MKFKYIQLHTLEERVMTSERLRRRHPHSIPVIIEKLPNATMCDIEKNKFLVSADITVGQFLVIIRKRMKLRPEDTLFLFVKNVVPSTNSTMGELHQVYHANDKFLYLSYANENVYGDIVNDLE